MHLEYFRLISNDNASRLQEEANQLNRMIEGKQTNWKN